MTGEIFMCRMREKKGEKMIKKMCYFRGEKVEKTLIFYTHTHTHTHTHVIIGKQKKSPVAILAELSGRTIRKIYFTLHAVLRAGLCEKVTLNAHIFLHFPSCMGLPLNRMVFFNCQQMKGEKHDRK